MKWTTDPVTQVLAKLRDSAALQGVDFCRAYPDQMKPSRLLRPVVAVCLAEMDGTSDAVGEESRAGQIALRFDLYAPPAAGTGALQQVLSGICRTLLLSTGKCVRIHICLILKSCLIQKFQRFFSGFRFIHMFG